MLKASLGTGAYALFAGLACAPADADIFAGATAEATPADTDNSNQATTTPSPQAAEASSTVAEQSTGVAVEGEMVISFTYTQAVGGLDERPYIAVWIEDATGNLVETVSLWYEQGRRGERWLDHLTRWFDGDAALTAGGGTSTALTISSATRAAGAYSVVWDGTAGGVPVAAGPYSVCIEAAREEGPHSLICEPLTLDGLLAETALPDDGELSLGTVRIDA